jgi:hypothetical protein
MLGEKMAGTNISLNSIAEMINTNDNLASNAKDLLDNDIFEAMEALGKANAMLAKANTDAQVFASVPAESAPKDTYVELL